MAFNGSGLFNIDSTGQPVSANTLIESADFNALTADLATGLSNCITKDGQQTVTANLPMATYRHTGVGNAVARTDYAAAGQVQDGKLNWVDGGGTADAITATYSPAITALVDGQLCCVRATAANATTTPTFAPNGLTARDIVKDGGDALAVGDIVGDGHELILRYDLTNTRWELLNPKNPLAQAIGTGDSPQFAGVNLGHASDTTLTRVSAGVVAVEGTNIVLAGAVTTDGITMATAKMLGRTTAGTGAIEEITVGSGLSLAAGSLTATSNVTIDLGTPQATTSGTYVDITGIASGTKLIYLSVYGVSTNGTSPIIVQIGDTGGPETGSYNTAHWAYNGTGGANDADGWHLHQAPAAAGAYYGTLILSLVDSATFSWMGDGKSNNANSFYGYHCVGGKDLSAELTQIRLTTVGGSDTFDAGKINVVTMG